MANHFKAHSFKVGDVVSLNSGGPRMTVIDIHRDSIRTRVACMWFAYKKQQTGFFFAETLKRAESPAALVATLLSAPAAQSNPSLAPILETPAVRQARRSVSQDPGEGDDWWADETGDDAA